MKVREMSYEGLKNSRETPSACDMNAHSTLLHIYRNNKPLKRDLKI